MTKVRLGNHEPNGISASMYAMVERGLARRPRVAKVIRGTVEFRFEEDFAAIRVTFGDGEVVVEDVPRGRKADLVIRGSLPDVVQLAAAPVVGAMASVARGKVRIEGSPMLARRLLKLLEI
jgi:hypothetical protein